MRSNIFIGLTFYSIWLMRCYSNKSIYTITIKWNKITLHTRLINWKMRSNALWLQISALPTSLQFIHPNLLQCLNDHICQNETCEAVNRQPSEFIRFNKIRIKCYNNVDTYTSAVPQPTPGFRHGNCPKSRPRAQIYVCLSNINMCLTNNGLKTLFQ